MNETPDQKIDAGIYVLGAVLGGWAHIFLNAVGVLQADPRWTLGGMLIGLLVAATVCKTRPRCGQEKGIWKRIDHFILTQMDLGSAFKKKDK